MSVEFYSLPVTVKDETADSVSVTFAVPDDLRDMFRHKAGQHVVLRREIDGEDIRRSYSICTSAGSDELCVGIKRIPNGVFSAYATQELKNGDVIDVLPPVGEFVHEVDPDAANHYVALAAGSGITPMLAIVTTVLETEQASSCTLVYGNRTTQSIMFLEDIEALKNRFHDRFQIVHVLSREPHEIPLFQGRIDADKIRSLASSLIDVPSVAGWYMCGPLEMIESVSETLGSLGVDDDKIHYELFFDERIESIPDVEDDAEGLVTMTVTLDGRSSVVKVDPDGPSVLDYARSVRAEVPFACKGGMCATCKAVVTKGKVRMDKNYALTKEEVDGGMVLTCQSHPVDGDITVSFDVHGGMGR